jgi:hypothetical protein
MAAIKFLQDIDIDGEIFLGEGSVSRINMTIGSGATENKYKQTLGSNYLQFDLDPDQQQSNSNFQFRIDLGLKMTIGTDVTVSNDLYVNGGEVYMGGNSNAMFDNSADSTVLLIGDTQLDDSVAEIKFYTWGQEQFHISDGELICTAKVIGNGDFQLGANRDLILTSTSEIIFDEGSVLTLNDNISTDGVSNGTIYKPNSQTVLAGKIYGLSSGSPAWVLSDADSDITTKLLAIPKNTQASQGMLLNGIVRDSSHGFTIGAPLYVSNTSGVFTNTAPTGTGDYVRVVGYAIDANHIYFNPDNTWVQLA